jgi:hypothetical protein
MMDSVMLNVRAIGFEETVALARRALSAALELDRDRPRELVELALHLRDFPQELVALKTDRDPTGADQLVMRLEPSDGLRRLVAALRAWNPDCLAVEMTGHDGFSDDGCTTTSIVGPGAGGVTPGGSRREGSA